MRASRLLHLLLLLQSRGPMNATALALALGISARTVYRDVGALSDAGVPVYVVDGPRGGYALVDGWQTRLTGLTDSEADTLALVGLPGPAAELGLGAALAATELKLLAALPPEAADRAGRIRQRFHLDAVAWFRETESATHLKVIAAAVWQSTPIAIRYRRWAPPPSRDVERTVQPLGMVCKAGAWYLVARPDDGGSPRTYRVGRIRRVMTLPGPFDWPEGFDLAAFWKDATARYEADLMRDAMTLRLSPAGCERLAELLGTTIVDATLPTHDPQGWTHVTIPTESTDDAVTKALQLGPDAEVLAPDEVRRRMIETLASTAALYGP
ncbi:transcriptional regulator [Streptomyces sp. NBC_00237]|uniref:helix-turn-helix transcriptional regulator n=1 Tax=Streptomyces sp. NBC_00237 TaxID=2975687 RepID=UPI00224ECD80|nr:transcriptional regulator [Streptomyces sp. NBC_00237]MCX5202678.1 transcriptional regulator [Streptomyces sp. NBC_00237]